MILWIYLTVFLLYISLVVILWNGWKRAVNLPLPSSPESPFISVIVPVRNEEKYIGLLVKDLSLQEYPKDKFEIIIVDDHSEDRTLPKIEEVLSIENNKNFTILKVGGKGKKFALTKGISLAKGEVIATTDGDCRVSSFWLQSIAESFSKDVQFVFGAVRMEYTHTVFAKMQAIEFASLIGTGAATWALGSPTMCNGANLAFRKNIFTEAGGYTGNEHIASGDDEFLMRKIAALYPDGLRFNSSPASIVTTHPQYSLAAFQAQRLRWAAKWRSYGMRSGSALLALFIFLFHSAVVSLPVMALLGWLEWTWVVLLLVVKALGEWEFLNAVAHWCGVRWSWRAFFLLQFFHSLYVVIIGVGANFLRPVWKGRPV